VNHLYYDEVILIGSGKIASESVSTLLNIFNNKIIIIEYEVALFSPFSKFNKYKNIKILKIQQKEELTKYLNDITIKTLIISANNNYIFKKKFIEKQNIFIVNFHNALLPKHRGRNAQMWTIFSGDKYAGATWHVVNSNIDDGDILIQEKIQINTLITSIKLTEQLINIGIKMFNSIILDILNNTMKIIKQKKTLYDTHTSKELPNNGFIDLSKDIDEISLFLRSMDFGKVRIVPYPKIFLFGEEFDILSYNIESNFFELNLNNQKILKIGDKINEK
jgi:methionyl-tRNA formyltransferase